MKLSDNEKATREFIELTCKSSDLTLEEFKRALELMKPIISDYNEAEIYDDMCANRVKLSPACHKWAAQGFPEADEC